MVVLVKVLPFFYEKFLLKSLERIVFFAIFVINKSNNYNYANCRDSCKRDPRLAR